MTNCHQLKMPVEDGKMRLTDVADPEQLLRIIQSIPSPQAEPFKRWLAQVGRERLDEIDDPELAISRALLTYRRKGYSESWINQRLKSIKFRKALTEEWERSGVKEGIEYANLTDIITKGWSDMTTREYKNLKGLKKENLRDNMTNMELALNITCGSYDNRNLPVKESAWIQGECRCRPGRWQNRRKNAEGNRSKNRTVCDFIQPSIEK